jgi:hypothetical protein
MENNIENKDKLEFKDIKLDEVTEGKVTVFLSNEAKTFSAFYNPAQVS